MSDYMSVSLYVCRPICLSVYMSVSLLVCKSIRLSVEISVLAEGIIICSKTTGEMKYSKEEGEQHLKKAHGYDRQNEAS